MELYEGLISRRSIRHFTGEEVAAEDIRRILKAAVQAPSGLNNQPWKFVIVRDAEKRRQMSESTKYARIIREAPVCLGVFVDRELMYHDVKDHQAMGACIQNILLAAHALGLGAVWLGEILKNAEEVRLLLEVPEGKELMAVVALGHTAGCGEPRERKPLEEVILGEL